MTLLSKTECSAMRGFAIIGIFLHNYLHWLGQMVKENEYLFSQKNAEGMFNAITSPDGNLIYNMFSFFGHYGVPVFLFLSGYGLVMKYEVGNNDKRITGLPAVSRFLGHHFMKLFPMMLLGFVCFAMVDWVTPGRHHWTWLDIITQLTMTINLFPDPDHIIWPGPYWFFGLIMQLYLVYILVLHRYRHWTVAVALILLCWVPQALCAADPEGELLNRLRYNCIGGMLPFCLGVIIARAKETDAIATAINGPYVLFGWINFLLAAVVVVLSFSCCFHSWLWVPLFIIFANIALIKSLPRFVLRFLDWMGMLSAAIFVCHPITRKIFIPISRGGDILDGLVLYTVATVMLAIIFRRAMRRV